jgi:hypothetical protein
LQDLVQPAWVPTFRYETTVNFETKAKQPRSFHLPEYQTWECPKSLLRDGQAYELVRKYQQARRNNTTLTKIMHDDSPFLEDVEEVLHEMRMVVKNAWAEERDKR